MTTVRRVLPECVPVPGLPSGDQSSDPTVLGACRFIAVAGAEPGHADTAKTKEGVNDARAIVVNAAEAAAGRTSSIHLRCLVRLKLRQFLLQPVLQVLTFIQREAEILKSRMVAIATNASDLLRLLLAVGVNQFHPDIHLMCQRRSALLRKRPQLHDIRYPQLFPTPVMVPPRTIEIVPFFNLKLGFTPASASGCSAAFSASAQSCWPQSL